MSFLVSTPTMRKTVLVLGRSAAGLAPPAIAAEDEALVVLAIGWPLSDAQRSVLDAAEETARRDGVLFDAHLIAGPRDIVGLLGASDRLMLDAKPREARRIRRELDRR